MENDETPRAIKEVVRYSGKLFEVVERTMEYKKDGKPIQFTIELVRRPPGVRTIIEHESNILLIKEYRAEYDAWDYRLPGGKIFDSIQEQHDAFQNSNNIEKHVLDASAREVQEEAGLSITNQTLFTKSVAGASVEWDLYYVLAILEGSTVGKQELGIGEMITPEWKTRKEVEVLCLRGDIREDRTVAVLLKYLLKK